MTSTIGASLPGTEPVRPSLLRRHRGAEPRPELRRHRRAQRQMQLRRRRRRRRCSVSLRQQLW